MTSSVVCAYIPKQKITYTYCEKARYIFLRFYQFSMFIVRYQFLILLQTYNLNTSFQVNKKKIIVLPWQCAFWLGNRAKEHAKYAEIKKNELFENFRTFIITFWSDYQVRILWKWVLSSSFTSSHKPSFFIQVFFSFTFISFI